MKSRWLVVLLAACTIRVAGPFRLPPPEPGTEPTAAGPPPPPRIPRAERRSAADQRARQVAQDYDQLRDELAGADQEASSHQDGEAAEQYRQVADGADRLLDKLADAPAPAAVYPTRSDGPLDQAALIAKLRDVRAQADRLGKAAHARSLSALEAELHARTAPQRAVVADHGRPDEVQRRRQQTCWIYRDGDTEETFCWTAAGRLAKHAKSSTAVASRPPPENTPTQSAPEPERPKPKPKQLYYAAATFAAGSCNSGDCFRYGWTTRLPDGNSARTSCSSGECAKYGWTTDFPDGESASTSCSSGECMKYGWTTSLPHDESASSSCSSGDCLKYGWSTSLPSGSVSCSCNSGDCTKYGASCD